MSDLRKVPRRFPRAVIALFGVLRWLGSSLWPGKAAYRRWLARGGVRGERVDLALPDLPPGLEGLRLVQISDLHGGCFLDEESLQPVVDLVRAWEPDVLVVTGDFISQRAEDVYELGTALARMPAALGRYAVLGNHDYRGRREHLLEAALRRQGVRLLRNGSVLLEREGGRLRLVGLEDIEESRGVDLEAALAGARPQEEVTVLLCHHPDVVESLPPGRFELVLCGHGHGGQVVLPLVGSLARAWLPRRSRGTHALPGGGWLHVNRGIGVLVLPLRLGAPAEVTCVTLRRA